MQINSGKNVNKTVKKAVYNWWNNIVQNIYNDTFLQENMFLTWFSTILNNSFSTDNTLKRHLLSSSFTTFTHSSTITSTILNNKKEINF